MCRKRRGIEAQGTLAVLGAVLFAPAALLAAAGLAWSLLSQVGFFYPLWYDALAIDAHIEEFGPQNRYRDGFAETSRSEHLALFDGLLTAVNDHGRGLQRLAYRADGDTHRLLRRPEIAHLEDVARLLSALRWAALLAAAFLAVYWLHRLRSRRPIPQPPFWTGLGLSLLAPGLLAMGLLDAERHGWFGRLHEWIFPAENQWFFYYQESLMTTLLKAPDLFVPLGVQWLAASLALFAVLIALLRYTGSANDQE